MVKKYNVIIKYEKLGNPELKRYENIIMASSKALAIATTVLMMSYDLDANIDLFIHTIKVKIVLKDD